MRSGLAALALAACSACSAQISDARGPAVGGVGSEVDAGQPDAAIAATCTRRTVYLDFDGQALTQGATDAALDQARWLNKPQGTAAPYRAADGDRDAAIQAIVDGVRAQLAQFPITVSRTRPSAGSYAMIVFGGDANTVGSDFGGAVDELDCGDRVPSDVAWISDNVTGQRAINSTIGAIGFGLGLTATTDQRDCMCGWDNDCRASNNQPCRLGSPIARDPKARQLCPDLTPQDEVAAFRTAFCQ